jgi:hypothetical protein
MTKWKQNDDEWWMTNDESGMMIIKDKYWEEVTNEVNCLN